MNAAVLEAELGKRVQTMFARNQVAADANTLEQWPRHALPLRLKA